MNKFTLFIFALVITNIFFLFSLQSQLKKHEVVIDRHGLILSVMLETPEIKEALYTYLQSKQQ